MRIDSSSLSTLTLSPSLTILLLFSCTLSSTLAAKLMKPPQLTFDIFHIKTPQLIGIIFGCIVFSITIASVITLLYKSGTFTRLTHEIKSGKELKFPKEIIAPQMAEIPELHDHLLYAKKTLPLKLAPPVLNGKDVQLRQLESKYIEELFEVGNGTAKFDESAYDPERLWGWLPNFIHERPYESFTVFQECIKASQPNESHLVIIDQTLKRVIGMISLTKNDPVNLTVQIDNLWLTPAFQRKKVAHEAILILSQWLIEQGYRRITCEIDSRHIIGRKFVERCQWKNEGTLRKHRIVKNRNRDTVLYSMLNSDWIPASIAIKKHIGLDWKPKTVKIADIQSGKDAVSAATISNPTPNPQEQSFTITTPSSADSINSASPAGSPAVVASKRSPKKKSATPKKRREKGDSSDEDEEILVPIVETQSSKLQTKSKDLIRPENISHAIFSSVETPVQYDSNRPLDPSDPNLYVEDHIIPTTAIDWQPVEKRSKKKK